MLRPHRPAFAAVVLAIALTGCSGEDDAAGTAIEEAAEQAGEDVHVEVDGDGDGDEVTIQGSEGAVTVGGALPDGFPVDDIPLVDGDVLMGMGAAGQGFQVTLDLPDPPADVLAAARELLEGVGFAVDDEGVVEDLYSATLSSEAYAVSLTATEADGRTTLIYSVEVP